MNNNKLKTMNRAIRYVFTLFIFIYLFNGAKIRAQLGQSFGSKIEVLRLETILSQDKVRPQDTFKLGVKVTFLDDWHINSNKPSEDYLIATTMDIQESPGFVFGNINYPPGHNVKFDFSEKPISVYEDTVVIWLEVEASSEIAPGIHKVSGRINYQACNNSSCLPPTEESFSIAIEVVAQNDTVSAINSAYFSSQPAELAELKGERGIRENEIDRLMQGSGFFLTLVFIFFGGLALNLTPCVYPIIPITIGFFVGQASGHMSRSFLLALTYVIGMAVTYSVLGVVAAMTGGLLGASLQNPLVLIAVAVIFLIFAASMFGAFEIRVPGFLNRIAGGSKQGYVGSLLMGLTVGIVAAPCIGPFVISLLTYVAAKGDPFTGFILFFVLSSGLGLPYLVLGTFSGSIQKLPRSGEWMLWVKKVFGFIMIALAAYFISSLMPGLMYVILITAILVLAGLAVGFFDKSKASFTWFTKLKAAVGIALIVLGLWQAISAWRTANAPQIDWQPYDSTLIANAQQKGRPIIIDFYADWCIPCKQLDRTLFRDPDVVGSAGRFLALKADLTQEESDETVALRKEYNVLGVPTIVLLDRKGKEYQRFTDELVSIKTEAFLNILDTAFENP